MAMKTFAHGDPKMSGDLRWKKLDGLAKIS